MAGHMQNKVCLITGGAGSIGAASAKLLRHEGATRLPCNRPRQPLPFEVIKHAKRKTVVS